MKLLLSAFIIVIAIQANAQISRPVEVQKQNIKLISPSEQVSMRTSLSTLKVHYEDIHSIILSSRAIQHWIFLLEKLLLFLEFMFL